MALKIIFADDHRLMREGLRLLLGARTDYDVIAEAGDGRTAVSLAKKLSPDLVIMDVSMPDLNGIEATRQIVAEDQRIKVLALSMLSDKNFAVEMLNAGASGYILKDCASDELIIAIKTIFKGQIYLSPSITTFMLKDYLSSSPKADVTVFSLLTNREREVLQLIAEGKTTKEIATLLSVSSKTVDAQRQSIFSKLNIRSVAELTKYAIREGLTSL